ncbi:TPA: hypothetical protein ACNVTV_004862 [Citrobacter freundii]
MTKEDVLNSLNPACLKKAEEWESPTCGEVRAVIGLTGLSGSQLAKRLGLKDSRNVRNWQMLKDSSSTSSIPYAAWALLCYFAGLGLIFE